MGFSDYSKRRILSNEELWPFKIQKDFKRKDLRPLEEEYGNLKVK